MGQKIMTILDAIVEAIPMFFAGLFLVLTMSLLAGITVDSTSVFFASLVVFTVGFVTATVWFVGANVRHELEMQSYRN